MNVERRDDTQRRSPLGPLFGFIVLISLGALSFLAAPALVVWLETTQFTLGARALLPVTFPVGWSALLTRSIVAVFIFVLVFTLIMLVLFLFMPAPRGELDVELAKVRAQKEREKKS